MHDVPKSDGSEPLREPPSLVRFAGLVLNVDARTLERESGEVIRLTRGEFALLRVFVTRPGRVVSRDVLLDARLTGASSRSTAASTCWSGSCAARSSLIQKNLASS